MTSHELYGSIKTKVYKLITSEPQTKGIGNLFFNFFLMALIVANVIMVILESIQWIYLPNELFFNTFEMISLAIFTVEYILRLWTCTEKPQYQMAIQGRVNYAKTPMAIIDLLAIIPFYLPFLIPIDLRFLRILRLFRLIRLFKLGRYSYALNLLKRSFTKEKEILIISFFILIILLIMASSLMYYVEYEAQPDTFSSIPTTMWWAIATLTTVGYGDIYPITPLGKFIGAFIAILGIGMFAIPTGVLATAFIEEIQNKNGEKCKESTKLSPEDTILQLEKLDILREKGVINEEEFQKLKQQIIK